MAPATLTLTPAQIERFQQTGFLSLPAITTAEEVAGLCDIYDRLFDTQAGRAHGDHLDLSSADEDGAKAILPQILNPSKYAPELAGTASAVCPCEKARRQRARTPALQAGRPVALAMIENGRARMGEVLDLEHYGYKRTGGSRHQAEIVPPCAYDPEGSRLHA